MTYDLPCSLQAEDKMTKDATGLGTEARQDGCENWKNNEHGVTTTYPSVFRCQWSGLGGG